MTKVEQLKHIEDTINCLKCIIQVLNNKISCLSKEIDRIHAVGNQIHKELTHEELNELKGG